MEGKHHRRWVIYSGLMAFLVVLGGGLFLVASRLPPISDQVPWNRPGLKVQIASPKQNSTWPADAEIPLEVFIQGASGVERVELWANSRLVDVQTPPVYARPEGYPVHLRFRPGLAGRFYLTAIAVGAGGAAATSDVLFLSVSQGVGWEEIQSSGEGETLPSIAERVKAPLESLTAANPGLDPLNPLAPGTEIRVPRPPEDEPCTAPHPVPRLCRAPSRWRRAIFPAGFARTTARTARPADRFERFRLPVPRQYGPNPWRRSGGGIEFAWPAADRPAAKFMVPNQRQSCLPAARSFRMPHIFGCIRRHTIPRPKPAGPI